MLAVGFALLWSQNAITRRVYTPRSYWRFENASNWTIDEQETVLLKNWEGIGHRGGEIKSWHTEAEGGIVGGWVNSTGVRTNTSYETYWESEMGSVPHNRTDSTPATGITIELLVKPGPCFGRGFRFNFFSSFPPSPGEKCDASIDGGGITWRVDTRGDKSSVPVDLMEVQLEGTGVASSSYLFDGQWHHLAFTKDAQSGDQAIWIDGQNPPPFRLKGNATGRGISTSKIFLNGRGALTTCAGFDEGTVVIDDKLQGFFTHKISALQL